MWATTLRWYRIGDMHLTGLDCEMLALADAPAAYQEPIDAPSLAFALRIHPRTVQRWIAAGMVVVKKPAPKERKGINPFTKEPTVFTAKPARKVVKARAVKAAKDAVA